MHGVARAGFATTSCGMSLRETGSLVVAILLKA
jgi:hypothetical protein